MKSILAFATLLTVINGFSISARAVTEDEIRRSNQEFCNRSCSEQACSNLTEPRRQQERLNMCVHRGCGDQCRRGIHPNQQ